MKSFTTGRVFEISYQLNIMYSGSSKCDYQLQRKFTKTLTTTNLLQHKTCSSKKLGKFLEKPNL